MLTKGQQAFATVCAWAIIIGFLVVVARVFATYLTGF